MKKTKLDRIINLIREEMVGAGAPTNNVGSGNIAGANEDPPVSLKKKKRYIWTRGIRKNWKKKGES